jgi:hypothetical protein
VLDGAAVENIQAGVMDSDAVAREGLDLGVLEDEALADFGQLMCMGTTAHFL